MDMKELDEAGFEGYKVDSLGNVYGRSGKVLQYQYAGNGYKAVPFSGRKIGSRIVRIDKLMGAAFYGHSIDDDTIIPLYRDGDTNNVTLNNLLFVRK